MPRPMHYRPVAKPRVHIPDEKLDECIQRIVGEAKERKLALCDTAWVHPSHTNFNDSELCIFINKIAANAKARSAQSWVSSMPTLWEDASTHTAPMQAELGATEAIALEKDEQEEVRSPRKWGGC